MKKKIDIIICFLKQIISLLLRMLIFQKKLAYCMITVLGIIISNIKTDITDQSEEEKKKTFAKQENALNNAEVLLEKRNNLLEQFSKII